jgi:hypothetical protein
LHQKSIVMSNTRKILALIISLKRCRRNSIIIKKAKYKMANDVKLHPNTFTKYLKEAIDKGYILDMGSHYKVVKFKDVVRGFNSETSLVFNNHEILSTGSSDFNTNLKNLENLLFIDNIYTRQQKAIESKKEKKRLFAILKQTDKSYVRPEDYKRAKRLLKKVKSIECVAKVEENMNLDIDVRTSARHAGELIGMSSQKANKILNNLPGYKRKVFNEWFPLTGGVDQVLYLRDLYPKAVVYALPYKGKIKVCFGSTLVKRYPVGDKSYSHNLSM